MTAAPAPLATYGERRAAARAIQTQLRCEGCGCHLLTAPGSDYADAWCVQSGCARSYQPVPVHVDVEDGALVAHHGSRLQALAAALPDDLEVATAITHGASRSTRPAGCRMAHARVALPFPCPPADRDAAEARAAREARTTWEDRWGPLPRESMLGSVSHEVGGVSYQVWVQP